MHLSSTPASGLSGNKNAEREITKQKNNIIDSINYAQNIQQAILVKEEEIKKYLPDFFIFFKPRDIVSGDFYWFTKLKSPLEKGDLGLPRSEERAYRGGAGCVLIAAIDCTGHGVPGAFMSMIGNTLLNEIVNEKHIIEPAEILKHLHTGIITSLHQRKDNIEARDGMDVAICSLTPQLPLLYPERSRRRGRGGALDDKTSEVLETSEVYTLEYAGAKNPLYIINPNRKEWPEEAIPFDDVNPEGGSFNGSGTDDTVQKVSTPFRGGGGGGVVVKPDILSIGGRTFNKEKGAGRTFTNHAISVEKGTAIYLFSDGYIDQYNKNDKEKFGKKRFQQLLLDIYDLDMQQQKKALEKALEDWKGDYKQIDDILVIGIRI
ncbi:MAG: SpoIIE family protein phosphatase [Bacteroidota bacterium]